MNITRNNYETFFLLYADGELDAAGRQAVEDFVKLHPDLEEELDLLKDAVLDIPLNLTMPGKALLLRPEIWEASTLTPEQEQLLLLIDNELPAEIAGELKTHIASDPLLEKEWRLLEQTKLDSPVISMPSRQRLYREKTTREPIAIRAIRWMAAAAVVAGLGWFSLFLFNDGDRVTEPQVATVKGTDKGNTMPAATEPVLPGQVAINEEVPAGKETSLGKQTNVLTPEPTGNNISTPVKSNSSPALLPAGQQQPAYTVAFEIAPRVETVKEKNIETSTSANIDLNGISNPAVIDLALQDRVEYAEAMPAVYNEDPFLDDEDYVNIAGARIKKQKLRAVFRGVTRSITRTLDQSNVARVDVTPPR